MQYSPPKRRWKSTGLRHFPEGINLHSHRLVLGIVIPILNCAIQHHAMKAYGGSWQRMQVMKLLITYFLQPPTISPLFGPNIVHWAQKLNIKYFLEINMNPVEFFLHERGKYEQFSPQMQWARILLLGNSHPVRHAWMACRKHETKLHAFYISDTILRRVSVSRPVLFNVPQGWQTSLTGAKFASSPSGCDANFWHILNSSVLYKGPQDLLRGTQVVLSSQGGRDGQGMCHAWVRIEMHIRFWSDSQDSGHYEDLDVGGRIILKWILDRMERYGLDSSRSWEGLVEDSCEYSSKPSSSIK
jgi:hypothetical protein